MKIGIVDDHQLIRDGLSVIVTSAAQVEVVHVGSTAADALRLCRSESVDVLFLDIELPDKSGLEVADVIRAEALPTRIVAISAYDYRAYVYGVLEKGAVAFLRKAEISTTVIHNVLSGLEEGNAPWISEELARLLVRQQAKRADSQRALASLTKREREVLSFVAGGLTNQAIAGRLHLAEITIRNHVDRIRGKIEVNTRAELVAWAWMNEVVDRREFE